MVTFRPTGLSQCVSLSQTTPQVIELKSLPTEGKVIRLYAVSFPSNAICYVNLGTQGVAVSTSNGMPVDLSGGKEQFVGVGDQTHIALLMSTNANFNVVVTPGEIV